MSFKKWWEEKTPDEKALLVVLGGVAVTILTCGAGLAAGGGVLLAGKAIAGTALAGKATAGTLVAGKASAAHLVKTAFAHAITEAPHAFSYAIAHGNVSLSLGPLKGLTLTV